MQRFTSLLNYQRAGLRNKRKWLRRVLGLDDEGDDECDDEAEKEEDRALIDDDVEEDLSFYDRIDLELRERRQMPSPLSASPDQAP